MLTSKKFVRSTISLQSKPAPARPMPLSVFAQASDATWVPCPTWSASAGEPPPWLTERAILPASSGWEPSTPVSITPTSAVSPRVMSHRCGRFSRASVHCTGVPGRRPGRRLGRAQRRVVGDVAGLEAQLGAGLAHVRVAAHARGEGACRLAATRREGEDAQPRHGLIAPRTGAGGDRGDRGALGAHSIALVQHHHHAARRRHAGARRRRGER